MCLCAIAAPCNNEYYCMPKIGKHRIKCSVCGSQSHQPTCIWKKIQFCSLQGSQSPTSTLSPEGNSKQVVFDYLVLPYHCYYFLFQPGKPYIKNSTALANY